MSKPTAFLLPASVLLLWLAAQSIALAAGSSGSDKMTQQAGGYTIALKLLPAEPFVKPAAAKQSSNAGAMVNGGGASPVAKSSKQHPNHHLVAFIKKNGQPVENANVQITYQKTGSASGSPQRLPVSRMWVAGKGKKTTHYGNNVNIKPGRYVVHVTVNHNAKATFHLKV